MSGQENSIAHVDRGNGAVPAFPASLQEIVSILTQCHRLIGAVGVFRPASAMGSGWPDEERDFCRNRKDQLPQNPLWSSAKRGSRIRHSPPVGLRSRAPLRKHLFLRELHPEEIRP
jgi:hypothetical protein